MKDIINNTEIDVADIDQWRKKGTADEIPLIDAKYNAKAVRLLDELYQIRLSQDDPDTKINALIDILIRGVQFK